MDESCPEFSEDWRHHTETSYAYQCSILCFDLGLLVRNFELTCVFMPTMLNLFIGFELHATVYSCWFSPCPFLAFWVEYATGSAVYSCTQMGLTDKCESVGSSFAAVLRSYLFKSRFINYAVMPGMMMFGLKDDQESDEGGNLHFGPV